MVGGAVEADHAPEKRASPGGGNQLVGDAVVAERQSDLRLVDDGGQLARAQQRHGVDRNGTSLGDREPDRHHRRVVAGSNEHTVARLDAEVLDQAVGQPVGPVGQLLVGALPAVADQRDMIAEPLLDHAVGQFDGDVQVLRVLKLRPVKQQVGPLIDGRQMVPRKRIHVRRRTKRR